MASFKRILVTGVPGFVGQYVLEPLLELGYEVHGVYFDKQPNNDNVQWYQINLLDANKQPLEELIRSIEPTHCLHLAWYTKHKEFWNSSLNYSWLWSSMHLLEILGRAHCKRIVFVGSGAEKYYSKSLQTAYSFCKRTLSEVFIDYCKHRDINGVWTRLFHIYGIVDYPEKLIPMTINNMLQDKEVIVKDANKILSFLNVKDVAKALVYTIDNDKVKGAINILDDYPISIEILVNIIGSLLDKKSLLRLENSSSLSRSLRDNVQMISASEEPTTLQNYGWTKSISLEEGLKELINYYKEQNNG
jgi:nucleoside-diphosphate-sugar epimerase